MTETTGKFDEPWIFDERNVYFRGRSGHPIGLYLPPTAHRIRDCINAFAGITDVEAWMQAVEELIDTAQRVLHDANAPPSDEHWAVMRDLKVALAKLEELTDD